MVLFRSPVDFPVVGCVGDIVLSGLADYLYQTFPLQLLLVGISRSTPPEGIGGSTVWFCQNEGIPLTFDSLLFDCAMIKCSFVIANSTYVQIKTCLKVK